MLFSQAPSAQGPQNKTLSPSQPIIFWLSKPSSLSSRCSLARFRFAGARKVRPITIPHKALTHAPTESLNWFHCHGSMVHLNKRNPQKLELCETLKMGEPDSKRKWRSVCMPFLKTHKRNIPRNKSFVCPLHHFTTLNSVLRRDAEQIEERSGDGKSLPRRGNCCLVHRLSSHFLQFLISKQTNKQTNETTRPPNILHKGKGGGGRLYHL